MADVSKTRMLHSPDLVEKEQKGDLSAGEIKPELSTSAFEALEREFNEVIDDLKANPSIGQFRVNYEKLFRALKKSFDHEKRLGRQCRDLNSEIVNNLAKLQTALKVSKDDQLTIESLKLDADKAWTLVSASRDKEIEAAAVIRDLEVDLENVSSQAEKYALQSKVHDDAVKAVVKERDDFKVKANSLAEKSNKLEGNLRSLHEEKQVQENEIRLVKTKNSGLSDESVALREEIRQEHKRRERADKEILEMQSKLETKSNEFADLKFTSVLTNNKFMQLQREMEDAARKIEVHFSDKEYLQTQLQQSNENLQHEKRKSTSTIADFHEERKKVKAAHAEIARVTTEKAQVMRRIDNEHKVVLRLQQIADDAKTTSETSQLEVATLRDELKRRKRQEEQAVLEIEVLKRDKNTQLGRIQKTDVRIKHADEDISRREQALQSLEKELKSSRLETNKLHLKNRTLENMRENDRSYAAEQLALCDQANEEVKLRELKIQELNKLVSEWEHKLKDHKHAADVLRNEWVNVTQQLTVSKTKVFNATEQNSLLQEELKIFRQEVAVKNEAIAKGHFDQCKGKARKEHHFHEVDNLKRQIQQNEELIQTQNDENRHLGSLMRRMDGDTLKQRKEYDQVINERDILGTQLIRRNDELALLYEKVKLQESTLHKGEIHYQERLEDMRLLKSMIKDLQRDLSNVTKGGIDVDELSREIIKINFELSQEKIKVKALSDEIENPLNVHRWRKLEGCDPATYEMIQSMQLLQKRLIKKTEKVVEKDNLIQGQERKYLELKAILARSPGPEVVEQISIYQNALKEKTYQMKAMAGELNMHQSQVAKFKGEIDSLNHELQNVKRKYFEQKRREALAKEKELAFIERHDLASTISESNASTGTNNRHRKSENSGGNKEQVVRYLGGGFQVK